MLKVGTRVRIKGGPFSGREGRVSEIAEDDRPTRYEVELPADENHLRITGLTFDAKRLEAL